MTRNPATRNQARDRRRAERHNTLLPGKGGAPAEPWRRHHLERSVRDARDERAIGAALEGTRPANRLAFEGFFQLRRRRVRVN